MPGMSGLDVARKVQSIRADRPVAIAAGFVDDELQTQAGAVEAFCEIVLQLARTVSATRSPDEEMPGRAFGRRRPDRSANFYIKLTGTASVTRRAYAALRMMLSSLSSTFFTAGRFNIRSLNAV